MLARDEGASGPQMVEAMGWAPHTARGFLASLSRKGIVIKVLERVRQVGANQVGAKGSYTVYRVGDGRSGSPQVHPRFVGSATTDVCISCGMPAAT